MRQLKLGYIGKSFALGGLGVLGTIIAACGGGGETTRTRRRFALARVISGAATATRSIIGFELHDSPPGGPGPQHVCNRSASARGCSASARGCRP